MSYALIKRANEQLSDQQYHGLFLPYSRLRMTLCDANKKNYDKTLLGFARRGELADGLRIVLKWLESSRSVKHE